MLPSSELLARITEKHPLVMKASDELNDTARNYLIPGYRGSFGFISSMSDHFCGSCNRLRLTADGQIKVMFSTIQEPGGDSDRANLQPSLIVWPLLST